MPAPRKHPGGTEMKRRAAVADHDRDFPTKEAVMPSSSVCVGATEPSASLLTRYDIEDRFTVRAGGTDVDVLDVWCPIIQGSPVQRVLAMALDAPGAYTLTRDPDHGNRMLHARAPGNTSPAFTVRYTVERRSLRPMLDPACVGRLETPALFQRELSAEQFVDVNDTTRALARDVLQRRRAVLEGQHRARPELLRRQLQRHPRPVHLALPIGRHPGAARAGSGVRAAPAWGGGVR